MVFLSTSWIEFQITGIKTVLFLLGWYTQEVGFTLIWYFVTILEILIIILQVLINQLYGFGHVDSWGSPFACPSTFLTVISALITYVVVFHLWWHRPTWKPSISTAFYVSLFGLLSIYWIVVTPITPAQAAVSLGIGTLYGILTSLVLRYFFLPVILPVIIIELRNTMFINMIGSKNTLLIPRNP